MAYFNYTFSAVLVFMLTITNVSAQKNIPAFSEKNTPPPPDYSLPSSWAALPDMKDYADYVPSECPLKNMQSTAAADVFFLYPTLFTYYPNDDYKWNADVNNSKLKKRINESSIKYQSTVFNAAGRIYIPWYRQAHLRSFFSSDKISSQKALEVAYSDIRRAFQYYLDHYNNGRPIIIAGHSQGTYHAKRLLTEFFDSSDLRLQLVAAYLAGYEVHASQYEMLKPCADSTSTGCYVSWRTYNTTYVPAKPNSNNETPVCTNPLTWRNDSAYASEELNKGAVLKNFDKVITGICDAQVDNGILRIHKPNIIGKAFLNIKNYHKADYNLFYMNIRQNTLTRVNAYLK